MHKIIKNTSTFNPDLEWDWSLPNVHLNPVRLYTNYSLHKDAHNLKESKNFTISTF